MMRSRFESLTVCCAFIAVLMWPLYARATTYYMCNSATTCGSGWSTGSDSNPGTSESLPFLTLNGAFSKMSGGDTLIIGNGTYTGYSNYMTINEYGLHPPFGSSSAWTTVEAQHTGGVVFDGQNTMPSMFDIESNPGRDVYWIFKGLVWCRTTGTNVELFGCNYVKFLQCGAFDAGTGNSSNFAIASCNYTLEEGCYAYGQGHFKFLVIGQNPSNNATWYVGNQIIRNCVARMDGGVTYPQDGADFGIYSALNVRVQNCIAVDNDQTAYDYSPLSDFRCFNNPTTNAPSYNIHYENSVCLNSGMGEASISQNSPSQDISFYNCIWWSNSTNNIQYNSVEPVTRSPFFFRVSQGSGTLANGSSYNYNGAFTFQNNTCGLGTSTLWPNSQYVATVPFWVQDTVTSNVTSNIFTQNQVQSGQTFYGSWGNAPTIDSTYNDYYGNSPNPASSQLGKGDSTSINPIYNATSNPNGGLKWLPITCSNASMNLPSSWTNVTTGSNLCAAGSGGGPMGANLIYLVGTPGTIWGQTGYDSTTSTPMWPYPDEALIKSMMASYSYTGEMDEWDIPGSVTSGSFQNDEIVTSSSGAYGWVKTALSSGGPLVIWSLNGTPGANDTWTGKTSGAKFAATAVPVQQTGTVTGARGFCAPGNDAWGQPMTLTRYIWEYLGNEIPSSIYQLGAVTGLHLMN